MSDATTEVLTFLKEKPKQELQVVVMPDFFLDRIINLNCTATDFHSLITGILQRKGGSQDGIQQTDLRGGNAVNVASALAALGVKVTPILCTSKFGLQQLRYFFRKNTVDTSHIKIFPNASVTTALEFQTANGKTNVMLRDVGSLAEFGPAHLTDDDWSIIELADYVCLFNWAGTQKYGTELAETVFRRVKTAGKGKTYFATADPTPNKTFIPKLLKNVLRTSNVDVLSLNENETLIYASMLDSSIGKKQGALSDKLILYAAEVLADNLKARIDIHTTSFSLTKTDNRTVTIPAFEVDILRATGAGDAWDAGNIVGDAYGLSDEGRLTLANATAACYLSDPKAVHPSRLTLLHFLKIHHSQIFKSSRV
ncbi:MAG: carbohydrate kinase family protein [Candidatus Bathyarchaeota archaeon]|nr:carbohydrate kinase family protein [Candidatus Bathyarchaeota archaeon]